ncbi:hypothetical protein PHYSODRAFT_336251 [Phytophthora sojae]|uniref:Uncharacterized protein n=1 Tax=Phytophthora sojae (strain P6497) TaxID=1094619 RepID=G4ZWY1_PHYSP|nr:hypothetical protein PHYSODRAFT_336251 [Phytophthora sojae]EGZ11752.1 hypothetical protein PHYSODRAFT_336251 [Phytophthora sojae]|eukprot:XP_009532085.1 hypothetical protein PHYSODRAFT_336251 [Phytophthora sojae]
MTMRGLLHRIRHAPSSKTVREGAAAAACEDHAPQRQSRRSRVSHVLSKAIDPADEAMEAPTRRRKRDRIKNYFSRRRSHLAKSSRSFLWPAMLSSDKDESRCSEGTESDDVYMVDYQSDSDSDDDSLCDDNYVTPPVAIPEMYRRQDRMGGITVAGARVLFTFAGFKRQQMMLRRLQSVSEADELVIPAGVHREYIVIPAF